VPTAQPILLRSFDNSLAAAFDLMEVVATGQPVTTFVGKSHVR
jgi:hypothetical protein